MCILLTADNSNAFLIQFMTSYVQRCSIKSEKKEPGTARAMEKDRKIEHLKIPKKINQKPIFTGAESKSELSEAAKVSVVPDEGGNAD